MRSRDSSWYTRVFVSIVSSSNAKMMSAPSWCWTCIETSGVNRWMSPLRWDRKVTPSSSTFAIRSSRATVCRSARSFPANSVVSTFFDPTPRLMTWNPPESVKVGPGQFMNAPRPPASSTMSGPGCRNRW